MMKQAKAANLTILIGLMLVLAGPVLVLLGSVVLNYPVWGSIFGIGLFTVGVYVGGLLLAVGVYVRLQSMSTTSTAPVAGLCPQCGRSNALANKYCDKCGADLSTWGS
jgi:hypothetical protein